MRGRADEGLTHSNEPFLVMDGIEWIAKDPSQRGHSIPPRGLAPPAAKPTRRGYETTADTVMAGVAAWLGLSVWPRRAQTISRATSYGTQDRELWAG